MTITRIESLVFGVEDIAKCTQFYVDAGLALISQDDEHSVLSTPERQTIAIKSVDDPSLPPAMEQGSTLRELIWGVADQAGMDRIKDELSKDREVRIDDRGVMHSHDETGFGIGFRVSRLEALKPEAQRT